MVAAGSAHAKKTVLRAAARPSATPIAVRSAPTPPLVAVQNGGGNDGGTPAAAPSQPAPAPSPAPAPAYTPPVVVSGGS